MRNSIQILTLAISLVGLLAVASANAEIILDEEFEYSAVDLTAGALNFTASEASISNPSGLFHDGTSDYFTVANVPGSAVSGAPNTSVPFSGFSGQFFIAEDLDDGGTRPGTQTLSFNVDVAGYTDLTLDMLFAAGGNDGSPGYDTNDGFLVRAQLDGGGFQNLLAFEAIGTTNMELRQDADFNGVGDASGFLPTTVATAFNGLAITGTGTNLLVEFVVSSNDGNGEFAFDGVVFNGTNTVPEPSSFMLFGCVLTAMVCRRRRNG